MPSFLSSVSASMTPPWPGLGAYAVSKAALDKLVEAWRAEHPDIGFTRVIVGECMGGEGDSVPGFADGWDQELAAEVMPVWFTAQLHERQLRRRREPDRRRGRGPASGRCPHPFGDGGHPAAG